MTPRYSKRNTVEKPLNVDIDRLVYNALREYAKSENVTKKLVVETALRRFLVSERMQREERLAAEQAQLAAEQAQKAERAASEQAQKAERRMRGL